ncbi:MAG: hypothetical protein ACI8UR_002504 [Natronomonas sp.]|uniref:DUF7322 domain-containing protein n=1 Tax=Natronomonas sp. TaxID=2184060 RepID=UPI0039E6A1BF
MTPFDDEEGDPWPDEPEEFDPDSLGPETPDVEPDPEEAMAAAADVDEDLFRAFWGAAVFLNVAIAALALGALLIYFRGDWTRGGQALLVGTVAALFTARFYFSYRPDDAEDESTIDSEADR